MKIILINDVKKQGKKGDIIDVKDGYGSFLIKKGDAVLATSTGLDRLNEENALKEKAEKELIKEAKEIKKKIEKLILDFKVKTGDADRVFGSVTTKQIESELNKLDIEIDRRKIKINENLSSLGIHNVEVELHKSVTAILKVKLVKEG